MADVKVISKKIGYNFVILMKGGNFMIATGEGRIASVRRGVSKKTKAEYFAVKILDAEAEEFVNFFIEEDLFNELESLPKNTPVILTLNLALASKYFRLESIEPIETH